MLMTDKRLVLSTASSREEAQKIAGAIVEGRLAACVQIIGPMHSVYRWEGAVKNAEEFLVLMKTTVITLPRLRNELQRLHSYEIPECIEIPVESGLPAYMEWIDESVR
jgi:periplasmic divalent cation tolerance protein